MQYRISSNASQSFKFGFGISGAPFVLRRTEPLSRGKGSAFVFKLNCAHIKESYIKGQKVSRSIFGSREEEEKIRLLSASPPRLD